MNWLCLILAGLFEIGWAIGLKYTQGFTQFWPSVATLMSMLVSLLLLGIALKTLPLATAYAIWVGIGATGTAILGAWLLHEPLNSAQVLSLLLIVAGIAGLKISSGS